MHDQHVGFGLTNGLYKLTATVLEDPPETLELMVGDWSVAVTNAGEYVFLLEKGVDYYFGTVPYFDGIDYEMCDDLEASAGPMLMALVGQRKRGTAACAARPGRTLGRSRGGGDCPRLDCVLAGVDMVIDFVIYCPTCEKRCLLKLPMLPCSCRGMASLLEPIPIIRSRPSKGIA